MTKYSSCRMYVHNLKLHSEFFVYDSCMFVCRYIVLYYNDFVTFLDKKVHFSFVVLQGTYIVLPCPSDHQDVSLKIYLLHIKITLLLITNMVTQSNTLL